jgi:DNA modification methylase
MNTTDLKIIKKELQADSLKVLCDGAFLVDWRKLLDLQTLDDGRSLKDTDDEKILRLAESLLRFGIVNNLQVWFDENDECYCFDAHHRRKAFELLNEIGVEIPPLPSTRCLASSKVEAMRLLLVKESKSSWVNYKVVPDYLQQTGFSFKIASRVIDLPEIKWNEICEAGEESEEDRQKADEIPDSPLEIHIKTGDLIELGAHRLLCGDSTSAKDVKKLMEKEKADMVFTDPPYGINLIKGKAGKVGGGTKRYPTKEFKQIINDDQEFDPRFMLDYANVAIIWGGNYYANKLSNGRCWFIWDKRHPVDRTFCGCELAWTNLDKHSKIYACVWDGYTKEGESESKKHPSQKPVKLYTDILLDISERSNIILDLFLGSGTTMIACEKTNRRCFAMEIDPQYCQVSVQRWVDFTGQDEIKINGQTVSWSEYAGT